MAFLQAVGFVLYDLMSAWNRAAAVGLIRNNPGYRSFLGHLEATPRTWSYSNSYPGDPGQISDKSEECPLTKVMAMHTGRAVGQADWLEAGFWLGLKAPVIVAIMRAADHCPGHFAEVRADLVRATGLSAELPPTTDWDQALAELPREAEAMTPAAK